jgi:iron complex transport system substrate-binding protein
MRGRLRNVVAAATAALLAVALAACGGNGTTGATTPAPVDAAAFPVTIPHKLGTTTIPAEPKRIVALSFEEDTLGALGITPIAYAKNPAMPGGRFPWLAGRIDLSASTELTDPFTALDLEQIASLRPDLILATNLYGLENSYAQLSRIAPTVGFIQDAGLSSWQEVSRLIGKTVGRSAQTEQAIAGTESAIAAVHTRLPGLTGKTFSSSFYYQSGQPLAVIDDPTTISVALYAQLGLRLSPAVTAAVHDRSLSLEQVGALDADYVSIGFANNALKNDFATDPLFQAIPAVHAGRAYQADAFTAQAFNNPSLLNIPWQLDQIAPVLQKVAAG